MATQDYKAISVTAKKRRADALVEEASVPIEQINKLPKDLTTISQDPKLFSQHEIEIINSEPEDILLKIRERIWTALEVTEAFCKAAAIAQQLTNCLTEILFAEARAQAKALDTHLATTSRVVGPLHGLPISLKDCFITPPHPSSIGIAAFANGATTADQESTLPALLRSLGAVAYVKTNVPVAMMMKETDNNVWGPTCNPYHRGLSPGGSSGGEAALIALRGSPLGVGTDIGGSVRIPSAFTNLYGLRPSSGRFPAFGTRSGIPGQEFIMSVNGPMARTLESLNLYCTAVLSPSAAPWNLDPKCVPMPWKSGKQILPSGRKLRLAIAKNHDGKVTAHPPIDRAITMTRKALEAAGHEVVDWANAADNSISKMINAAFLDFGGTAITPLLEAHSEPVFQAMAAYAAAAAAAKDVGTGLTPDKMRENNLAKWKLQKLYLDRWQAAGIDGIIAPVSPWAAPRLGVATKTKPEMHYTAFSSWVNVLDLSAASFPVTFADKMQDPRRPDFKPLSSLDQDIQEDYDPDFYDGAPVALQLIGERLQEEKVLEMVAVVRDCLNSVDGKIR